MKKILLLIIFLGISNFATAQNCLIIKEKNHILKKQGKCNLRHSPCSTFKIAISLMGYNENILLNETNPEFPFELFYVDWADAWREAHNPITWMKNSCVWYSQLITKELGKKKLAEYTRKFNYGNCDVSGDKSKDNGLTSSWLTSSLKISPQEQMVFLESFLQRKFSLNQNSYEMTKNILFLEELQDGWKLYGKTGAGYIEKLPNGTSDVNGPQLGWFIGWIEKNDRKIVFVNYLEEKIDNNLTSGKKAKEMIKGILLKMPK